MEAHRNNLMPSLVPQVGMEFTNSDVAWAFWLSYCGQKGFEVRKRSYQVGVSLNLSYTLRDHKNYLRTKWQQEMAYGQASSMLKYFQDKIADCPSFQYALQMDGEELIANILWVDAKMIADYARFGDVVSFDTTFGTSNESGEKNEENNEDTSILSDFNACIGVLLHGAARQPAWLGMPLSLARHFVEQVVCMCSRLGKRRRGNRLGSQGGEGVEIDF
uniref:Transposon protein, putative, unclassified n=1 Tax=Oryza sativa subsp. japonica TaxID=39947 RepID=Q2QR71_ORYSJ|nr:transposon protein, putative, unclassified [Oryza sativa Japonica Group]